MPDDRLFHRCLGHSDKVNRLTEFEDLIWRGYVLSANDFGVMRFGPLRLRADHDRFATKSDQAILKALTRVRDVDLIRTFSHQGHEYCYQWDWQMWQRVRYPRRTSDPLPSPELIATCCPDTQWLFSAYPGGKKLASWMAPRTWLAEHGFSGNDSGKLSGNDSGKLSGNDSGKLSGNDSGKLSAPSLAVSLLPLAVSRTSAGIGANEAHGRQALTTGGVMAGSLPRDHVRHHQAACNDRGLCVPDFLNARFIKQLQIDQVELDAFYASIIAGLREGPISDNPVKFWEAQVAARWPSGAPRKGASTIGQRQPEPSFTEARERGLV